MLQLSSFRIWFLGIVITIMYSDHHRLRVYARFSIRYPYKICCTFLGCYKGVGLSCCKWHQSYTPGDVVEVTHVVMGQ